MDCIDEGIYGCFQFINEDGSLIWSFPKDADYVRGNLIYTVDCLIAHWSADNKFVYLVTRPDSWHAHFSPVFGIIKFSLVTGEYSYIITPNFSDNVLGNSVPEYMNLYGYGFSNNSQWLAYALKHKHSINFVLLDLYTGDTEYFSVIVDEGSLFGDISWSPNDRFFVFSAAEHMDGLDTSDDFSVFLVTLEDLSVKRIYPHGDLFLYSLEWISNKEVRYSYLNLETYSGEIILNIETGEVTEMEP